MSSYVLKSKKTFQPKAPNRRGATSASNTPSIRDSQEPTRVSATPQPSAVDTSSAQAATVIASNVAANIAAHNTNAQHPVPEGVVANAGSQVGDDHIDGRPVSISANELVTPASSLAQEPSASSQIDVTRGGHNSALRRRQATSVGSTDSVNDNGGVSEARAGLQTPPTTQNDGAETHPSSGTHHIQEDGANALLQLSQASPIHGEEGNDTVTTLGNGEEQSTGTIRKPKKPQNARSRASRAPARGKNGITERASTGKDSTEGSAPAGAEAGDKAVGSPKTKGAKAKPSGKKATRRISIRAAHDDETEKLVDEVVAQVTRPRRQTRKRKRNVPETAAEEDNSDASGQIRRKRREETPEDAEAQRIDQTALTMGDLPALKIGRLGERELRLRARDEERRSQAEKDAELAALSEALGDVEPAEGDEELIEWRQRQEEQRTRERHEMEEKERIFDLEQEWSHKPSGRYKATRDRAGERFEQQESAYMAGSTAPDDFAGYGDTNRPSQFHIVDGQMVLNPDAAIAPEDDNSQVIEKDVTELDKRMNYASFKAKEPIYRWNDELTEKLVEGIRMFGMDFGMIAMWIPGTSRAQVKSKYTKLNKEPGFSAYLDEMCKPEARMKVTKADIERMRGKPLIEPEEWSRELQEAEDKIREAQEELRREQEALLKNRGKGTENDDDDDDDDEGEEQEDDDDEQQANENADDHVTHDNSDAESVHESGEEHIGSEGDIGTRDEQTENAEGASHDGDSHSETDNAQVGSIVHSIETDAPAANTPPRRGGRKTRAARGKGAGRRGRAQA